MRALHSRSLFLLLLGSGCAGKQPNAVSSTADPVSATATPSSAVEQRAETQASATAQTGSAEPEGEAGRLERKTSQGWPVRLVVPSAKAEHEPLKQHLAEHLDEVVQCYQDHGLLKPPCERSWCDPRPAAGTIQFVTSNSTLLVGIEFPHSRAYSDRSMPNDSREREQEAWYEIEAPLSDCIRAAIGEVQVRNLLRDSKRPRITLGTWQGGEGTANLGSTSSARDQRR